MLFGGVIFREAICTEPFSVKNMYGNVLVMANRTVITPIRVIPGASMIIEDGQITCIIPGRSQIPYEVASVDAMTAIDVEERYAGSWRWWH